MDGITLSGGGTRLAVIILKGMNLRPEDRPAKGKVRFLAKVLHCTGAPGPDGAKPDKFRGLFELLILLFKQVREKSQIGNQDFLIRGVDHTRR